jgi:hypothetical protein
VFGAIFFPVAIVAASASPRRRSSFVPHLLHEVHLDPFSDHQLLNDKHQRNSYLLYSIAPDAKDDGGTPIYNSKRANEPHYVSFQGEKGDIVAGINK